MNEDSKVFLTTNGCPENRIDLARMREFLIENKWKVVDSIRESDLILFNACALTHGMQENSMKIISELNLRKKPSTELIVCGCLPKINNERLRDVYQNMTFGSDEIERFSEALNINSNPGNIYANYLVPLYNNGYKNGWHIPNLKKLFSIAAINRRLFINYYKRLCSAINVFHPYSFCIKISTGCLTNCSYCAVKISRGILKSKPLNKVTHEFAEGLAKGFTEFSLIGTDTGSYGRDQGITLVTLLKELLERKGDYQIRLRNVQPRFLIEMMPELQEFFKTGKISYIGTAVQSGNNRILKLMNRKYTIEGYKEAIQFINKEFPQIQIRTQIMVGFPSETEEEYQDSVRLLDELSFDIIEVYNYSPRLNTQAAKIKEKVPPEVARKRYNNLLVKSIFNEKKKKNRGLRIYKEELNKWQQKTQSY
jgi:tRNA A37 methylthiotransferase MiaB